MKIIHCADLHLDSSMNSNLSKDKAKERRNELLVSFRRMINYASANNVDAIIIAGDLFDTHNVSATARNTVYNAITSNPEIKFYYLKGNHDADSFLANCPKQPDNLYLFGDNWTNYCNAGVCICGAEISNDSNDSLLDNLVLNSSDINIVVLHGQIGENKGEINLKKLKNKGIDYLALGHIHNYTNAELDARGRYIYSGCLEGRGFDECGECGFVLMHVDEDRHTIGTDFIPFAERTMHEISCDISGTNDNSDILFKIQQIINSLTIDKKDMVKVVLTGEIEVECEINTDFLAKCLEDSFYFVKITDKTTTHIDYNSFLNDMSLKGEFMRTVMSNSNYSDEEKAEIVRLGFKALKGEDLM